MPEEFIHDEEAYINAEFVDIITSEKWDFQVPFVVENPEEYESMQEIQYFEQPNDNFFFIWSVDTRIMQEILQELNKRKDNEDGERSL
tara:strand:- start:10028 stop:10291 length:264 start_codon:yes stop_codon:yes gene_type:complete